MKRIFSKWYIIIMLIVVLLSGCSSESVVMSDKETIIQLSSNNFWIGAVSNTRNCYIRGSHLFNPFYYGVIDLKEFNSTKGKEFVCIYDKGDAEFISLSNNGGCITTINGDVYLFLNGTDGSDPPVFENDELLYRTPELFVSGYHYAELSNGEGIVYLLTEDNDLGYVTIDSPNEFHLLCSNVEKFKENTSSFRTLLIVLTTDNRLIILNSEDMYSTKLECFENILDFDIFRDGKSDRPSLIVLDENHDTYIGLDNYLSSFDSLDVNNYYKKIGEGIVSVTAYDRGVAMLDDDGSVSLYGSDLSSGQYSQIYNGEVVFTNVSFVSGDPKHLYIIRDNGEFEYYGKTFDGWNNNTIVSDFI